MKKVSRFAGKAVLYVILTALGFLFISPILVVVINSFKSFAEIFGDPFAITLKPTLDNYKNSWETLDLVTAFRNSLVVTVCSMAGEVVISAMAAHRIVRNRNKFHRFLYFLFVSAMIIPFPALMIPELQVWSTLELNNTLLGLIFCYFGFGTPFAVFLYHGFIKTIPAEIEEAPSTIAASTIRTFFSVVVPMLKPTTATLAVLHSLWFWNDFLLPQIMLQKKSIQTLPLVISYLFDQFNSRWDLAMSAIVLTMIPALIIFFLFQKNIVEGIAAGAVKG